MRRTPAVEKDGKHSRRQMWPSRPDIVDAQDEVTEHRQNDPGRSKIVSDVLAGERKLNLK